jgi:hypothetical protein
MITSATSKTKGAVRWLKRLWAELDYAERRAFEIRTGVPVHPSRRTQISRTVDELERLYAA